MENPGETLIGDYLSFVLECDFVDFSVCTKKVQGEIDVIGINNIAKQVYICEVVTHLATGIQYTKNKRPDTGERLARKFIKDIAYGKAAFDGYEKTYMLWSPCEAFERKGRIQSIHPSPAGARRGKKENGSRD
jgi:hypothetical protein